MEFHIVTLFPDIYPGFLRYSISGRALSNGLWKFKTYNIRDFSKQRRNIVDGKRFGGGEGMVIRVDVLDNALERISKEIHKENKDFINSKVKIIYFTPKGKLLDQDLVKKFVINSNSIILLCGRYEGVDQRIFSLWEIEEISVGDYILSSGDSAAFIFMDACIRLIPGVIRKENALIEESFELNLLEYPLYTKPKVWKDLEVPQVLLNGNHKEINLWRIDQSKKITMERRLDLWEKYKKDFIKRSSKD